MIADIFWGFVTFAGAVLVWFIWMEFVSDNPSPPENLPSEPSFFSRHWLPWALREEKKVWSRAIRDWKDWLMQGRDRS